MIIEHPETLRTWLTNTLSPICDADPAALAKYVMALLKKDKSEQDLKDFCVEQLDVFLQKETKGFVDQLFLVINDKSYINVASTNKHDAVNAAGGPAQQNVSSSTDNLSAKDIVNDRTVVSSGGNAGGGGSSTLPVSSAGRRKSRDNQKPANKRAASRSPSKSPHSRSRSKDRNRGGEKSTTFGYKHGTGSSNSSSTVRDRDKENRELRYSRQHSPRDRKRHLSRESGEKNSDKDKKRKRQRCRDYDEKGYCMRGDSCMYDHGPDPVVVEEVSLPRMITMKAPPPPVDFSQPPPGYSIHPPPPGVDHGFAAVTEAYNPEAPSISSSVVSVSVQGLPYGQPPAPAIWGQPPMPVYPPVSATAAYNPVVSKAGFRTRELITLAEGDPARLTAAYDHNRIDRMGVPIPVSIVGPIGMSGAGHMSSRIQQAPSSTASQLYDKTNRTLEVRRIPSHLNTISKLNEHFSQFGQIINIQVRYQGDAEAALVTFASRHQAVSAYKSTAPILNNRFVRMFWHNKDSPFGGGEGSTGERGSVRDRLGPAPIDPMTPIDDSSMKARRVDTVEDADGNFRAVLLTSTGNLTKTLYNPVALRTAAAAVQKSSSVEPAEPAALTSAKLSAAKNLLSQIDSATAQAKKLRARRDSDVQKKKITFQKAKMDLYNKHIEYQKKLLGQLEKCKDPKQRKEIAKTMKTLDGEIKKLRDELGEINSQAGGSSAATVAVSTLKPSKEQIERQLLDAELEMINQRQSGADTTDLHKRLMDLRREVMALNEMHISGANSTSTPVQKIFSAGGSGTVGTTVATVPANNHLQMSKSPQKKVGRPIPSFANLDKRPRELLVTGFQANERDALIEHFQQFGILEDLEYLHQNKDQPQQLRALVAFKLRKDAEMAMQNGKEFNNHTVDIQWFNRRSHIPSDKEDSYAELTAQDLLATLDDEDDISSDDNQLGEIDEEIPEIERGWKR